MFGKMHFISFKILCHNEIQSHLLNDIKVLKRDLLFVKNRNNDGYAIGNNIGIQLAIKFSCDNVLLLNNDTIVQNESLQKITNLLS